MGSILNANDFCFYFGDAPVVGSSIIEKGQNDHGHMNRDGNSDMGIRYLSGIRSDGTGYMDDFLPVGGIRTNSNQDRYGTDIFSTRW
jgi:hypothetical protein